MTSGLRPTVCPMVATVVLSSCVRLVVVMANHRPAKMVYRGVCGGARCRRRCLILFMHAMTGQKAGLPERLKPMRSPRTPFFWLVNSKQMNVVASRCGTGQVEWFKSSWCR
jgi:hypothetical protein